MIMNKEIDKYISVLQSGVDNCDNTKIAADFLLSKDSEYLSINKVDVARLFYQILCSYGRIFGEIAHETIGEETYRLFNHISGINTDEATQSEDSNLMTIWFLNELYQKLRYGQGFSAKVSLSSINYWIMGLDDIKYIFKIKDSNGDKIFPINRLILKVLQDDEFISVSKLTQYHIRIFQLAVELFEEHEEQKVLNDIKEKCNLQFLEYLDGTQEVLDSKNYMNYQKNGVMIFYNESKKSILIRHEKEEYFHHSVDGVDRKIQTEYNIDKNPIGFFVIVDADNILLRSYRDVILQHPQRILELVYKYGCYNIFFNKALIIKENVIFPINPYAAQDRYIVDEKGIACSKEKIQDVLRGYNLSAVKRKGLDCVSIGLCITLLEKENVGVDSLGLDSLVETDWYQNQITRNWAESCKDPVAALKSIMSLWGIELDYVCKKTTIQEYCIKTQNFLPYQCSFDWMYSILHLPSTPAIYEFEVEEDEEGSKFLKINNSHTVAGKLQNRSDIINIDEVAFDIQLSQDEKEEFWELGIKHYLTYDESSNKWNFSIQNETLYMNLMRLEIINQNSLPFDLRNMVSISAIDNIKSYMYLHKDSLLLHDVSNNDDYQDFDAIAIYRLIHNLLWNRINAENWQSFYKIIIQHQKASFSSINQDAVFHLDETGVLYVPKENERSDSSLSRIYHEYLKDNTHRSNYSLYFNALDFNAEENKYYIKGNRIRKIVFLFDNICLGRATIISLATYLDRFDQVDNLKDDRKAIAERAAMKYICEDRIVSMNEIIYANEITEVKVHSYYGTQAGVEAVGAFLEKCGLKATVSCSEKLTKTTDAVFEELSVVWPEKWNKTPEESDSFYMFIREFNQPKKNVFPDEMLVDPRKAICLFVKKKEI